MTPPSAGAARPVLLQAGFRPFFLLAGLWAAAALALWVGVLHGGAAPPSLFWPALWHAHEMLYGFVLATLAGFLLTAMPNWTSRPALRGAPLAVLVALWLAGRAGVAVSAHLGLWPALGLALAFPAALAAVALREILAARNWRNLVIVGALAAFAAGSLLMHLEAAGWALPPGIGGRLGVAVIVLLISLVGGRIVPNFTRNWLARHDPAAPPPAAFGTVDRLALAATGLAMALYVGAPGTAGLGGAAALAAVAQAARLARWRGGRTLREPLLAVLHLGYGWLAVGLALLAAAAVLPAVPASAGMHALTAGAAGTMTLAVMTRATRGHTGRPLTADAVTVALYAAVTLAALARVAAALLPAQAMALYGLSGGAWIAAFLGFAASYGALLLRPAPGPAAA